MRYATYARSMSKTTRRKISRQPSRRTYRPIQPRYRTLPPQSEPADLVVTGIVLLVLVLVALFILAQQYTWAFDLLGGIFLVGFIALLVLL